ncbi:DUF4296 domain-containing protein [Pontibacter oryzae]|uniref:DUF4296 domain-containing protein n=1 Tax=Pontibacter oryzae TaxID=2304593 RepID=A0A399SI52_9BACT|nr:DUF4296 domain-containing protein [Pontibacter oryzae]RIJ41782.1 DUF4296 domain-containing protein [Pontibacter oryzae]
MKKLFCILFCLSLLGCQRQNDKKPDNLIPESKLVPILADIHMTEALIESNVIYPDTALMVFNKEQEEIFEKYGVTSESFKETYRYYLQNLTEMDALYETVVDTLSLRETKIQIREGKKPELEELTAE